MKVLPDEQMAFAAPSTNRAKDREPDLRIRLA